MVRCHVGLGANIGDPLGQLQQAVNALRIHRDIAQLVLSHLYRSPPMGPSDQPDYLNAVARLDTGLAPEALLDILQEIEHGAGRKRGRRWGPRTLDLDLLLYGDRHIDTPRLTVPHPGLDKRAFVLVPLRDLAGADFLLPGGQTLAEALARCMDSRLQPVADPECLIAPNAEYQQREQ